MMMALRSRTSMVLLLRLLMVSLLILLRMVCRSKLLVRKRPLLRARALLLMLLAMPPPLSTFSAQAPSVVLCWARALAPLPTLS